MIINWNSGSSIVQGDTIYSYIDLKKILKKRAFELKQLGVKEHDKVIVCVKKNISSLINILAVNMIGATFIPIDSNSNDEFIEYIANENNAIVLGESFNCMKYNNVFKKKSDELAENHENSKIEYIIYTSGSTGRRKGVKVTNLNLNNYVKWFVNEFDIKEDDVTYISTSISYDLSYTGLFTALYAGAGIVFPTNDSDFEIEDLISYINGKRISYIKVTPSIINMMICSKKISSDNKLRLVVSGGERIVPKDIAILKNMLGENTEFVNHYGPTETTIGCCFKRIVFGSTWDEYVVSPTIGKAIKNTKLQIVNKDGSEILSIGTVGELFITGAGVADGYVDGDPRGFKDGGYYSGDLAKYNDNYEIVLCGRISNIIKINGYRTSVYEIQSYLNKITMWKRCAVIYDSCDSLVRVFYENEYVLNRTELIKEMKRIMPSYLIPKYFMRIDKIPFTSNGKVNNEELKKHAVTFRRPLASELYNMLNTSYSLGDCLYQDYKDCIFDDLGIDSLTMMSIFAEIEEKYGVKLPMILRKGDNIGKTVESIERIINHNVNCETYSKKEILLYHIHNKYEIKKYIKERKLLFKRNIVEYIDMRAIQKKYFLDKIQLDNIMHSSFDFSSVVSGERILDFLTKHYCFKSVYFFKEARIGITNLTELSIPYYLVESYDEIDFIVKEIMNRLSEFVEIPYLFIVMEYNGHKYLECFYCHYAILDRDLKYLETPQFDFDDNYKVRQLYDIVHDEIVRFDEWINIYQNEIIQEYIKKCVEGYINDSEMIVVKKACSENELVILFAKIIGACINIDKVPLVIFRDSRCINGKIEFLGDQTDYCFIVVDLKQNESVIRECVSGRIAEYEKITTPILSILEKYGKLRNVPKDFFSINIVSKGNNNLDDFQKYVYKSYSNNKKKIRTGISLFACVDPMLGETQISIGTNIKNDTINNFLKNKASTYFYGRE